MNIKELLITNEEDQDKNRNASNANSMTTETNNQNLKQNQPLPLSKGQLMIDSKAILANILMNIIATDRELELLQEDVQKAQGQNTNLQIGL
jgi:hypothetical protein